ncbi:putative non-specific protein-tyrosine kinase RLK-Pelle-DLSV family [Helianthus anomalus]
MIFALQHKHLVKLHGCCIEGNRLLLAYEYMENNSLARALFGKSFFRYSYKQYELVNRVGSGRKNGSWNLIGQQDTKFASVARGLAFLHEESTFKIVHRDIKTTNVLLDKNLDAKISDFGLAKLDEEDDTHISTRVAGTYGYMAPEYTLRGYLTDKAHVYSFRIVLLEIVSGTPNIVDRQWFPFATFAALSSPIAVLSRSIWLLFSGRLQEWKKCIRVGKTRMEGCW